MASNMDISTRITNGAKFIVTRAPARNRACLIQYSGETLGRRFVLDTPEIIIGRVRAAGIFIPDDSVSREHAKIISIGSAVEVEDLGSSNGTFIQDQRVQSRTALRDGDLLRLGSIQLKFFAHDNIESAFHDKIYRMATIDAGTQLFNKKYLLETLDSEFRLCRAYGRPLSVIYYDLDFFKKVNDVHGHSCGDFVLRECAQVVKSCMRATDILARFGGEEFVAVLPNADVLTATELAERIRGSIEAHTFVFDGKTLKQTISIGVSENQSAFKTATDLLNDADRKLYQSKQSGRNRVTV
ncbi:MAG: GGDEF domain-containing protein [Burkholderiales bacterium]